MARVIVDSAKAVRYLGGVAGRIRNPSGALKRVGLYLAEISKQSFRDQADPTTHRPWKPLSAATLKRRRGRSAQILVDTGRLRRSITSIITGKTTVAVGTATKYGKFHQFGTKHIPRRPFLGFDSAAEKEIREIVKRYIVDGKA